jgi:hypothetical protein
MRYSLLENRDTATEYLPSSNIRIAPLALPHAQKKSRANARFHICI